jgi:hypothetical protein
MTERAEPADTERTNQSVQAENHRPDGGTGTAPTRPQPRDRGRWAAKVDRLTVTRSGSRGANVAGRRLTGPVQGFGKMWQKTYSIEVGIEVSPKEAIAEPCREEQYNPISMIGLAAKRCQRVYGLGSF